MLKSISTPVILFASFLLLAACSGFSLAEDITPPPGAQLSAAGPTQPPLGDQLYPLVPPDPAVAEPIFLEKCAPCHGSTGLGDGPQASQLPNPPAPLGSAELARQATPAEWYAMVTQGNLEKFMPPFNSLSERQRWDVVAYLYTLSISPEIIAQGQNLYQEDCAECHGQDGQGDGPKAASLGVPSTDFTDQALMAQKSASDLFQAIGDGLPPDMPAFEEKLSADQRWALAAYLRSLTFASSRVQAAASEIPSAGGTLETQLTPEASVSATPPISPTLSGAGTVAGKVINSSGAALPEDLQVTLHGYDEMQETYTLSTAIQSDGTFSFEQVEMPLGRVFIASVDYQDATYNSDIAVVEADLTSIDLTIPIFETTTDTSALSIDRLHVFFEYIQPGNLQVIELFIISNLGDRTVVAAGPDQPVLTFDLPQGAQNLQFEDGVLGGRYIQTASGFGDTAPVRPGSGQHQLVFAFEMPYQKKLDLLQPLPLSVNAVVILVPEDGLKIRSEQLKDEGTRDVQGMAYHMYSSGMLAAGTDLAITITGRPSGAAAGLASSSSTSLVIGLAAFGLALILAGVWLYRRKRATGAQEMLAQPFSGAVDSLPGAILDDPDSLMDAIIALDDLHHRGELPEAAYHQRRAELKARLKELLANQDE